MFEFWEPGKTPPQDLAKDLFYNPTLTYRRDPKVRKLKGCQTFDRVMKTGSLPNAECVPVSASTEIDAHKNKKALPSLSNVTDFTLAWRFARSKPAWLKLSVRLRRLSAAIAESDPEFSNELSFLSDIALIRAAE